MVGFKCAHCFKLSELSFPTLTFEMAISLTVSVLGFIISYAEV